MTRQGERFQAVSSRYAQARPSYPDGLVRLVAGRLAAAPTSADAPVLDVGSGTGIFTAQLAALLPRDIPLIGVEPSEKMRAEAQSSAPNVSHVEGTAERLPVADGAARGVVAATAAHWFDRPAFYAEAGRALAPGGVIAIVEYVRDEASPAARAVLDFLNAHGEPRAYARPDYAAELSALAGFRAVEEHRERVTLPLDPAGFAALALSSSHARRAIETLGTEAATAELEAIGRTLASADGSIPFGYIFQAFFATRR